MSNPVAALRTVNEGGREYTSLLFTCPGCAEISGSGLHMLPVNSDWKTPQWSFDGDLEAPTVNPSILTRYNDGVCHSFMRAGALEFLGDCTHSMAGQTVPLPPLPDWVVEE